MTQPTLINLHPNEYSQELHYYPFVINLDRCTGGCITLDDLGNRVCVPNETKDLNVSMFNMITGINESNILTKHISCKCKSKFTGRKCNSNQKRNNDKVGCECKKDRSCERDYIWNSAACTCKNGKYLASFIDDSVIWCDEVIEETKTIPTSFNEKSSL